jgi:hypothetical protein
MEKTERQQILKAILLHRGFFTIQEVSSHAGVDENVVKELVNNLDPYLQVQNDDNPSYRIKPEFREALRDEAGYPPRANGEGGWGISK